MRVPSALAGSAWRRLRAVVVIALALPAIAPAVEVPDPAEGRWTTTTFALLRYRHDLCDAIAGKVIGHWRALGPSSPAAEKAVRDYVLERQLSELTAARTAGDVIRRFLPQARADSGREGGAALDRLSQLGTTLCDMAALPTAPRDAYQEEVAALLDSIEREEAELGRLVVLDDAELAAALDPYLVAIQLTGVEAEGEYLDYLESLRPKPVPPTTAELMAAWHGRYSTMVQPAKAALGRYLAGRRARDPKAIHQACRELTQQSIAVLRRRKALQAPDPKVYTPLYEAFRAMRDLASECTAGRTREVEEHFARLQRELNRAAGLLGVYSLTP